MRASFPLFATVNLAWLIGAVQACAIMKSLFGIGLLVVVSALSACKYETPKPQLEAMPSAVEGVQKPPPDPARQATVPRNDPATEATRPR